jgi:FkbM family methyltransferase
MEGCEVMTLVYTQGYDRVSRRLSRELDKAAQSLSRRLSRSFYVTVAGRRFIVPLINGIKVGSSEPWMTDVLTKVFTLRAEAFIDVGVNLGQTLLKVVAVDPGRTYVGFEPNSTCVHYVETLVRLNSLQHCHVVPVGLATHTSVVTLDLFQDDDSDPSASIVPRFRPGHAINHQKNVVVFSLQDLPPCVLPEAAGIIKIDVEGAELQVMETLLPVIIRDRPLILIEILPSYSEEFTDRLARQERIERIVRDLDYSLIRIGHRDGSFEHFEPLETIGIHGDLNLCDYILSPRELSSNVISE